VDSPLTNPNNCTQNKTWIVPLEFTVKVDDASKYDEEMEKVLSRVLNELRSIVNSMDGKKKQFGVKFLEKIKNPEVFYNTMKSIDLTKVETQVIPMDLQAMIQAEIKKALGK
jgi:predicted RNA-binding protein with EMAP domain